nr:YHYH domain-containing protein [Gammaproteobacteria bacterium]
MVGSVMTEQQTAPSTVLPDAATCRRQRRARGRSVVGALVLAVLPLLCGAHPGAVDRQGCHLDRATGQRHCHPERARKPMRGVPRAGEEGVFDGTLVWVSDGDTLRIRVHEQEMEIRLADIDAPERGQPYSWEAKLALIDLVRGGRLVIVPRDVDRYGRVVAHVWSDGVEINREMVQRGAAWFYPEFAESDTLYLEEQQARASGVGLWSLPAEQRLEPWLWRRAARPSEQVGRSRKVRVDTRRGVEQTASDDSDDPEHGRLPIGR